MEVKWIEKFTLLLIWLIYKYSENVYDNFSIHQRQNEWESEYKEIFSQALIEFSVSEVEREG